MRILIAEDSLTQAVDLRRRLEAAGHTVLVADDGLQAWSLLQARPEPLVISDWMMPELSGPELCRKIRAEIPAPYIYFILLTAKSHRHERLQGLGAGADDFLTKPVDSIELEIAVRTAMRILSAQEALRARACELQRQNQELSKNASLDPLTGLRGAGVFPETLAAACLRAAAERRPISLVRLEIDGYDWLPAGVDPENILAETARLVREATCGGDLPCRFGDHGFALILAGIDRDRARAIGEGVRQAVAGRFGANLALMGSVGVSTWSPGPGLIDPNALLEACEAELRALPR